MPKFAVQPILRRSALCVALGLCFANGALAQSTTGSVYGTVSPGEGSTVIVSSNTGFSRSVTVDENGRYSIGSLPVGSYTVTAQRNGETVGSRQITLRVGTGTDVSFGGGSVTLDAVTVTGTRVVPIDTTALDTRTIVTFEQLERLPITRSAESIALLAPGAVSGAAGYSALAGLVSFGGAGASENAYYINGYFSGEPLSNLGGYTLPYGAIAQQETYTGGYSAMYGRSDGGVISQIGKRGTNDWTFGAQITFSPKSLREDRDDLYLPELDFSQANANPNIPYIPELDEDGVPTGEPSDERYQYGYEDPAKAGTLYSRGRGAESENLTYSAYVGGPIIKDRLFFFLGAESSADETVSLPNVLGTPQTTRADTDDEKLYAKLDWNITDNHLLEFTYMNEKYDYAGRYYDYDFETGTEGALRPAVPTPTERESEYRILKYTGYLTDDLTLSAVYGESDFSMKQIPVLVAGLPYIAGFTNQNPAIVGGNPVQNRQGGYQGRDGRDSSEGLRVDLEWVVGDHTLTAGIDDIKFEADDEGTSQVADYWQYARTNNPNANLSPTLGVGAPGEEYYVRELRYFNNTSMSLEQKAWYLQDRWRITDDFLLSLGIRNDKFTNKNNFGEAYMDADNQWAPRIGAAWDVFGDASFKLFANAGRYFLALPNNVAIRGASSSTFTYEYFTYDGIDADGRPTGLTPVPGVGGAPAPGPVSSNGEYGQPIDVLAFAPSDLKNMYQDEYILGFETMLSESWMLGTKFTYRDLKSSVDDICDPYRMEGKLESLGIDLATIEVGSCYMFNPGGTNTFSLANLDAAGNYTGERTEVVMSAADWGFEDDMKRKYKALDIYLERPFDGTWEARIDYTFSFSQGNNEGQVKSEFGQTNISKTQDWDVAEMMRFAYGDLANDRRHQLKMRGSYALTPQWTVGGNVRIQSGMPISCLGFYNPDGSIDSSSSEGDPVGYGASYHTCFGEIARPGSERTPWTRTVDLGVSYRPAILDSRLSFGMQVFNVFDEQETLQVDVTSETDAAYTVSNTYLLPIGRQTPRTVMFTAAYDF